MCTTLTRPNPYVYPSVGFSGTPPNGSKWTVKTVGAARLGLTLSSVDDPSSGSIGFLWAGPPLPFSERDIKTVAKNRTMVYHLIDFVLEVHVPGHPSYRVPCRQEFIRSEAYRLTQGERAPVRVHASNPQIVYIDREARKQESAESRGRRARGPCAQTGGAPRKTVKESGTRWTSPRAHALQRAPLPPDASAWAAASSSAPASVHRGGRGPPTCARSLAASAQRTKSARSSSTNAPDA